MFKSGVIVNKPSFMKYLDFDYDPESQTVTAINVDGEPIVVSVIGEIHFKLKHNCVITAESLLNLNTISERTEISGDGYTDISDRISNQTTPLKNIDTNIALIKKKLKIK